MNKEKSESESIHSQADLGEPSQSMQALSRIGSDNDPVMRARDERAFVLTAWPWKETSLVADLFTRRYGRVTVAVRGAKRPGSQFRGLINPFSPLIVSFHGAKEIKMLRSARWMGGLTPLACENLFSGFYINELLLRLLPREVPHQALFDVYLETLMRLAQSEGKDVAVCLREFEVRLLRELGWGQHTDCSIENQKFVVRDGVLVDIATTTITADEQCISAQTVKAILQCDFSDTRILRTSRDVLRAILSYHMGDRALGTRQTMTRWQLQ